MKDYKFEEEIEGEKVFHNGLSKNCRLCGRFINNDMRSKIRPDMCRLCYS